MICEIRFASDVCLHTVSYIALTIFKNVLVFYFYFPWSGLLLVCVLTHEGAIFTEKKIVLGNTRDNFSVATAALAPSECSLLKFYILSFCHYT